MADLSRSIFRYSWPSCTVSPLHHRRRRHWDRETKSKNTNCWDYKPIFVSLFSKWIININVTLKYHCNNSLTMSWLGREPNREEKKKHNCDKTIEWREKKREFTMTITILCLRNIRSMFSSTDEMISLVCNSNINYLASIGNIFFTKITAGVYGFFFSRCRLLRLKWNNKWTSARQTERVFCLTYTYTRDRLLHTNQMLTSFFLVGFFFCSVRHTKHAIKYSQLTNNHWTCAM